MSENYGHVYLNLYNFDLPQHEDSPYIVTSPRSLRACHELGIQPRELLYKSLDWYEEELPDYALDNLIQLYEQGEHVRQEKLAACREQRLRYVCPGPRRRCGGPLRPQQRSATLGTCDCGGSAVTRTRSVSWAGLSEARDDVATTLSVGSSDDGDSDCWMAGDEEEEEEECGGWSAGMDGSSGSHGGESDWEQEPQSDGQDNSDVEPGDPAMTAAGDKDRHRGLEAGAELRKVVTDWGDCHLDGDTTAAAAADWESAADSEDGLRRRPPAAHHSPAVTVPTDSRAAAELAVVGSGVAASARRHLPADDPQSEESGSVSDDPEPGWYPLQAISPGADPQPTLTAAVSALSLAGEAVTSHGERVSRRPPEAAPSQRKPRRLVFRAPASTVPPARKRPAKKAAAASAASDSASAAWPPVPRLDTVSVSDLTSLLGWPALSEEDVRVRPADRRILQLMLNKRDQEREQERAAEQERCRWRQEWLQQIQAEAARGEQQRESVAARRRAQSAEDQRRRQQLLQQHSQSLQQLEQRLQLRDQRLQHDQLQLQRRKAAQLEERRRLQRRPHTPPQTQPTAAERLQLLQRRLQQTEVRRTDRSAARLQLLAAQNRAWAELSEQRLQQLEQLSETRSQQLWQQLERRAAAAADNLQQQVRRRGASAQKDSAAAVERGRRVRAARQQREVEEATGRTEAAQRLQLQQQRALELSRGVADSRQLQLSRDNWRRQLRHRHSLRRVRAQEQQRAEEVRVQQQLEEARTEQFQRQRHRDLLASRQLALLAADLRQRVRSDDRSATFDKQAARAELERRVLSGPGSSCCSLYRARSTSHLF